MLEHPPEPDQPESETFRMANTDSTPRPPQTIKDALWQIRQQREADQDASRVQIVAEYYATTDALYATGAITRHDLRPGFRAYAYTGTASGKLAVVFYDESSDAYCVSYNETRFTELEVLDAVYQARQMVAERRQKAVQA